METNVETAYCRKCMKTLPSKDFYQSVDAGLIDTNGLLSVCKKCCNKLYDEEFEKTGSIEKSIHKICVSLNIKFSQSAVDATKSHIATQTENGVSASPIFSTYKTKLVAGKKTMDKSLPEYMGYEDVNTIYLSPILAKDEKPIPPALKKKWGDNFEYEEIMFLEDQFTEAKETHKADDFASVTLLKEVCLQLLDIKNARKNNDSTVSGVRALQDLMKSLAIAPNSVTASTDEKYDTVGLKIQEMELSSPAQWYATDGKKYEMWRDVDNVEEYFQKYFVRPLKNFITGSKDFNLEDEQGTDTDDVEFTMTDDGDLEA